MYMYMYAIIGVDPLPIEPNSQNSGQNSVTRSPSSGQGSAPQCFPFGKYNSV